MDKKGDPSEELIVDWERMEEAIILEPSILKVKWYELREVSNGIMSELSSKMALVHLHKKLKRIEEFEEESESDRHYLDLLSYLEQNLPDKVLRFKNGENVLSNDVIAALDPNLILRERVELLEGVKGLKVVEQQKVIDIIHNGINVYVNSKGHEYMSKIAGPSPYFFCRLFAAGDGSGTAGLLGEKEAIREGRHKLGKPKGVGLFTYETRILSRENNEQYVGAKQTSVDTFHLSQRKLTNVHMSIWGFNYRCQATVILSRDGNTYPLYASKITRELSPDTTFGRGKTIHSHISKLKETYIPEIIETITGKEGLEVKVERAKKELEDILLKIKETEYDLNEARRDQVKNRERVKVLQTRWANYYQRSGDIKRNLQKAEGELEVERLRLQRYRFRLQELEAYLENSVNRLCEVWSSLHF